MRFGSDLSARGSAAAHEPAGGMTRGVASVLRKATEADHRHARYLDGDLGECFVPVNAAVADAVHHAAGIRLRAAPIRMEHPLRA